MGDNTLTDHQRDTREMAHDFADENRAVALKHYTAPPNLSRSSRRR